MDHDDEHGGEARQEGATAQAGGGAEATGRGIGGEPAARVLRAAQAPIQHCLLTESVFEIGMGTLVLTRGGTQDHLTLSSFLIDTFCLGIKDVMFQPIEREAFEMYMERMDAGSPMVSVDPSYARKLLRDLAAWSQSIGFAPHRDFAAVRRIAQLQKYLGEDGFYFEVAA